MKKWMIWTLAVLITLLAAYYQRKTGPTHPDTLRTEISGQRYTLQLPRSHTTDEDCTVSLPISDPSITGALVYRIYPSSASWDTVVMEREGNALSADLPAQPAAGKLAYQIMLFHADEEVVLPSEEPVVIRFKGSVPAAVLVPHIFIMFFAMLLSSVAGLMAVWKKKGYKSYAWLTLVLLIIGGGILGPIVQKYAFGALWTGIPFGWDLTDNKTLIALVVWIAAVFLNRKHERPGWIIAAAIVLLMVYSIPHSLFGSEFNYETGEVVQGLIRPFLLL